MAKTHVFIRFDFDNDKALKDVIVGQARLPDSPLEIADHSLKRGVNRREKRKEDRPAPGMATIRPSLELDFYINGIGKI